jgi:ribonuclease Z
MEVQHESGRSVFHSARPWLVWFWVAVVGSCRSVTAEPEGEKPEPAATGEEPEPARRPLAPPAGAVPGTRVVMLGSGTPVPDPDRSGPAVAVVSNGNAYLVDLGAGLVRRAAAAARNGIVEIEPSRLTRVFVTHLHSDHTAGYPDLILTPAVVGRRLPLSVYGPPGIAAMTRSLLQAYGEDLAARSRRHPPGAMSGYGVEPREIEPGPVYRDRKMTVTAFAVSHGEVANAMGYRFEAPDRAVVISGDTAPADSVVQACDGCDVLVHEVYCRAGFERGPPGFRRYHSTHHTSTVELASLASRARPKLLVLYHLLFFDCSEEQLLGEIRERYRGEVALGEDLAVY